MKSINIICYDTGRASIESSDLHINNENNASRMTIDFTNTEQLGVNKWVDLVAKDGTSLRYDLGLDDTVILDLTYPSTIAGELIITPFVYDGLNKIKYIPSHNVVIRNQAEAGTVDVILRDDFIFDLEQRVVALEEEVQDMDVNIISSVALDVNVQDQVSPAIISKFKMETNRTTSVGVVAIDDHTIVVANATGFAIGTYFIIIDATSNRFGLATVVGVSGTTITLDTPFDFAYPSGSVITANITNMNVDGSSITKTFNLRDEVVNIPTSFDVTRIILTALTASAPSLADFGDLPKLTYGIVLRRVDGTTQNIFNAKSNADLANLMFDFVLTTVSNPNQGQNGFVGRLTFAGQNKIGVAIRLAPGENLEIVIQDDLLGLTSFEVIAEGHIVVP